MREMKMNRKKNWLHENMRTDKRSFCQILFEIPQRKECKACFVKNLNHVR